MVALTQNPTWTLACICLGAGLVQSWWARQVRRWWLDLVIQGSTQEEKRMQSAFHDSKKWTVRITTMNQNYLNFENENNNNRCFSKRGQQLFWFLL
jgi:hypothetical protein